MSANCVFAVRYAGFGDVRTETFVIIFLRIPNVRRAVFWYNNYPLGQIYGNVSGLPLGVHGRDGKVFEVSGTDRRDDAGGRFGASCAPVPGSDAWR